MPKRRLSGQRGFTLIEVLVVVAVLGIITSIALVALAGALDRAKQTATMADMRTIARTIEAYAVDNHFPPDDSAGLESLIAVLIPYQTNVLPVHDHWGGDLSYSCDDEGNYTIESYGRDGVAGSDIDWANRFDFNLDIVLVNGRFVAAPE